MSRSDRWVILAVTGREPARRSPRRRQPGRGPARNWRYRAWVRTLPSAASGRYDYIDERACCEFAHTGSDGGMKQKASDYSGAPLTIEEHREYHQIGKDAFERKYGISFANLTKRLTHAWFAHSAEVK